MKIDEFVSRVEDSIDGIEPGTLAPDTAIQQIPNWDSLAALSILAMINLEYEVEISGPDLRGCSTLHDLFQLVVSKQSPA